MSSSESIRLIVGLGNPGERYEDTWHNIGAMILNRLAAHWNITMKHGRGDFISGEGFVKNVKTVLMIPTSYMNRSGYPVSGWIRYYKIPLENVLVIYDDHDLQFGRIRFRQRGSSGGHKGIGDIIEKTNSSEISRLRIGIKQSPSVNNLSKLVLAKIPKSLNRDVDKIIDFSIEAIETMFSTDIQTVMTHFNGIEILDK